jgi:dienelactone hydrolase
MRRTVIILLLVALLIVAGGAAVLFSPWPENIVMEHDNVAVNATLYQPFGTGPFPAVVLLHGCAGLLDKHTGWAKQLVKWGYAVLIVDSFSTRGVERLCEADDEEWVSMSRARADDADAALAFLSSRKKIDAGNIGLMGWSYGGTTVLELVTSEADGYRAAVAFYPSCWQYLQRHPETDVFKSSAPLLIIHGTADDWTLIKHCRVIVQRAKTGGGIVSIVEYADARHDFDNPTQAPETLRDVRIEEENASGNVTVAYDRDAHTSALKDVRIFLGKWLGGD